MPSFAGRGLAASLPEVDAPPSCTCTMQRVILSNVLHLGAADAVHGRRAAQYRGCARGSFRCFALESRCLNRAGLKADMLPSGVYMLNASQLRYMKTLGRALLLYCCQAGWFVPCCRRSGHLLAAVDLPHAVWIASANLYMECAGEKYSFAPSARGCNVKSCDLPVQSKQSAAGREKA